MADPRTVFEENRQLRQQVEDLQWQVRELKKSGNPAIERLAARFGLTRTQALILHQLATGKMLSVDMLVIRCCLDHTASNAVTNHICQVRRKIRPLKIKTAWRFGYSLSGPDLVTIQKIAEGLQ